MSPRHTGLWDDSDAPGTQSLPPLVPILPVGSRPGDVGGRANDKREENLSPPGEPQG